MSLPDYNKFLVLVTVVFAPSTRVFVLWRIDRPRPSAVADVFVLSSI